MSNTTANELAETERDARLGTGGTGVLSFCPLDNNPPHSVPVSYGYETTDPAFYFGLSAAPESAKARLLPCAVTFVVHGRTDGNWWSVVAKGELTETTQSEISTETLRGIQHTHTSILTTFFLVRRKRCRSHSTGLFLRSSPPELSDRRRGSETSCSETDQPVGTGTHSLLAAAFQRQRPSIRRTWSFRLRRLRPHRPSTVRPLARRSEERRRRRRLRER